MIALLSGAAADLDLLPALACRLRLGSAYGGRLRRYKIARVPQCSKILASEIITSTHSHGCTHVLRRAQHKTTVVEGWR